MIFFLRYDPHHTIHSLRSRHDDVLSQSKLEREEIIRDLVANSPTNFMRNNPPSPPTSLRHSVRGEDESKFPAKLDKFPSRLSREELDVEDLASRYYVDILFSFCALTNIFRPMTSLRSSLPPQQHDPSSPDMRPRSSSVVSTASTAHQQQQPQQRSSQQRPSIINRNPRILLDSFSYPTSPSILDSLKKMYHHSMYLHKIAPLVVQVS